MAETENIARPIRILSLDGSDVYRAMHRIDGERGITVKDKRGKLDTARFRGFLDLSLDTDRIKSIYSEHKELPGSFRVGKEFTTSVVNVSFDYSVKQFFNKGRNLFVRDGYDVSWDDLEDHVCISEIDGEQRLLAIEVAPEGKRASNSYAEVGEPVSDELLGKFFFYDSEKRQYRVKRKKDGTETLVSAKENKRKIREWLYENGFDIDGVHYVRYKRSAGSSREGHCLFIAEPLYAEMMRWSSCGLDADTVNDQASWQAYISLTLSSIEKKIHIPRQSILLIKDQVSRFRDKVIRVYEDENGLAASHEEVEIENTVWDGEALLDRSVFEDNGYGTKGMMLLRNRFFKTCAFNTDLQKWFKDNGITRLSQLNGFHSSVARSIKDIKLVITESSLKYLKFKPEGVGIGAWFEKWLDNVYVSKEQSLFGVVKTDKATGPMGNRMVKTNYQLLNTLALTREDSAEILKNSMDFLHGMQKDPMLLRYHVNLFVSDKEDVDEAGVTSENYRQRLISDVMRRTDNFEGTLFYRNYRTELCKSFKERLKHGRILIDGGYHTLLGNGMEFLRAVIDKNYTVDEPLALADGEIYTPRFADGEQLLCERSPHITMGNLLVVKNKYVEDIEKYFNLGASKAIVCVNAIKSNLQQRLNGCDYDSDAMLITNEPTILRVAAANYSAFPVPYCDVKPGGKQTYTTSACDLAALDVQISENRIGEIVNLSQFLNSLYWDGISNGEDEEVLAALYRDICKLAVLSGMEIDKAKRLYPVSAAGALLELRGRKDDYKRSHGDKIPEFFAYITENETEGVADQSAKLNTAMSFIYDAVEADAERAPRSKTVQYTELFELNSEKGDPTGAYGKRRDSILKFVKEKQSEIRRLNFIGRRKNRAERLMAIMEADALFDECKERIAKTADDKVYGLLLRELDIGEASAKGISACNALLFATMAYANGGYLMKKLKKPEKEMLDLVHKDDAVCDGTESIRMIFGHPHVEKKRKR